MGTAEETSPKPVNTLSRDPHVITIDRGGMQLAHHET